MNSLHNCLSSQSDTCWKLLLCCWSTCRHHKSWEDDFVWYPFGYMGSSERSTVWETSKQRSNTIDLCLSDHFDRTNLCIYVNNIQCKEDGKKQSCFYRKATEKFCQVKTEVDIVATSILVTHFPYLCAKDRFEGNLRMFLVYLTFNTETFTFVPCSDSGGHSFVLLTKNTSVMLIKDS